MGCMIIAEMGLNHDGDLSKALKLCDAAKSAGADVVKTQTFIPELAIHPKSKDFPTLFRLALNFPTTLKIARHCEDINIEFMSTPDDIESLKFLVEDCGVKRIKLGSGSLLYEPLVDAAFDTGLPVLLSTGMASLVEIALVLKRQWNRCYRGKADPAKHRPLNHVTAMHCVSLYPCPPHLANVRAIENLRDDLNSWTSDRYEVGYSDHTIGKYAALTAVTLGAAVIEKHFTLDDEDEGPDHHMSMVPGLFSLLVEKVRMIEQILGSGRKEPSPEELAMIPRIRKDAAGFQPGL